jgi:hypothetical protein
LDSFQYVVLFINRVVESKFFSHRNNSSSSYNKLNIIIFLHLNFGSLFIRAIRDLYGLAEGLHLETRGGLFGNISSPHRCPGDQAVGSMLCSLFWQFRSFFRKNISIVLKTIVTITFAHKFVHVE